MGADINIKDNQHRTPLHYAIHGKRPDMSKLLVIHGADMYQLDDNEETPLLAAIRVGNCSIIVVLIDAGCDVNKVLANGTNTALHFATYFLKLDIIKLLVSKGADVNKTINNGANVFHVLLCEDVLQTIKEDKKHYEIWKDVVEYFVENGANIDAPDNKKMTPLYLCFHSFLHNCSGSLYLQLAKHMLKLGAKVNIIVRGDSLLHYAILFNRDIIVTLLEFGADYSKHSIIKGVLPYHLAIKPRVNVKFVKAFVKEGCPYNQDPQVWVKLTAIANQETKEFFAAEKKFFQGIEGNNVEMVKSAVGEGAIPIGRSEEIKYPLHFVVQKGYTDLVDYLLNHNSPPNKLDTNRESPLHLAARLGELNICRLLLRFGACYNYVCKHNNKTPAAVAKEFNHMEVVDLFKGIGRLFHLAHLKKFKRVVTVLKNKMEKDLNEYLIYANAINNKGETLVTLTMHSEYAFFHFDV